MVSFVACGSPPSVPGAARGVSLALIALFAVGACHPANGSSASNGSGGWTYSETKDPMTDGMIYKAVLDDIQSSNGNGVYAELTLQCTVKGDKQKYSTAFTFFNSKSKNDKGENAGQDLLLTSNMFHPTGGADYSFRIDGFPSQLGTATPDETNYSNEISLMTVSQMAGMKKLLLQAPMSNGPALFSVDTSGKEPQAVLSHCSGDIGQSIPLFSQIGKISEPAQAQSSAPTASSAVASSQAASEASSNPPDPAQNPDQRAPAQPAAGDTSPPN